MTRWIAASRHGSVLMHRVGGREYPQVQNNQCKTCTSPYRNQIENALLKSYGYTAIVRSLPEDAGLSTRNISEHFKNGHLPLDESVKRVIIEQHAQERGLDIEGFETTLANHVTFAKLGLQNVLQRMAEGELVPDLDHGIAFANLLAKVEEKVDEDFDVHALTQGFIVYMEAMTSVCSPEQVQQITDRIATNPIMRGLLSRSQTVQGEIE